MKIAHCIGKKLTYQKLTLAIAESCTGGLISNTLTDIPGSSAFLLGGAITYSNKLKTLFANVPVSLIKKHGVVSKEVAEKMAKGIRQKTKADFAIATTGIAGPTGGTPKKPIGLVFIAVTSKKECIIEKHLFKGNRIEIKEQACKKALKLLNKKFL